MTGFLTLAHHAAHAGDVREASFRAYEGIASYYGPRHNGHRTASGGRFDQNQMTGAHAWLPFGTKVRVTAAASGRSVIVTITDRMAARRRVIDLSMGAARRLGILGRGIALVSLSPG